MTPMMERQLRAFARKYVAGGFDRAPILRDRGSPLWYRTGQGLVDRGLLDKMIDRGEGYYALTPAGWAWLAEHEPAVIRLRLQGANRLARSWASRDAATAAHWQQIADHARALLDE